MILNKYKKNQWVKIIFFLVLQDIWVYVEKWSFGLKSLNLSLSLTPALMPG